MISLLLSAILLCASTLEARQLAVPASLSSKAVYYIKSEQLDIFCCGYNALFNGCNLEVAYGFKNDYSDYKLFSRTCLAYAHTQHLNPKEAVGTRTTSALARKKLSMQPLYNLDFDEEGSVCPLVDYRFSYSEGTPHYEIEQIKKQAMKRRASEVINEARKQFDNQMSATIIKHFICIVQVQAEGHAILASVVQYNGQRALYLFDNLNGSITEYSQIKKCVDYLCYIFNISPRQQFKGPRLPEFWPSIPRRRS